MMRHAFTPSALLVLLSSPLLWAEDWPEFRGPTGQGISASTHLPTQWGPDRNTWKVTIPGQGWSSPVVVGGRVYLTTSVPTPNNPRDLSLRVLCLDAAAGKTLWDLEVLRENGTRSPRIHTKNSHASPTPLVRGQRLFVHFGHQGTACLDTDGKVLWRNTSLTYAPVHGNGGSPILVDDALVFSADGGDQRFVAALDVNTGKVLWKTERTNEVQKTFSFSTPLLIDVKGQKQIVSPGSNVVSALDPATGREIWRVHYDGYSVIPRPVYGHGLVFLSTGYNTPSLLAIRPDGKGDVTATHIAWKARQGAPHTPSLLLVGDELYMVSDGGQASCLDARTGRVHWQKRIGNAYSASPLFGDGKIYFQSEDGVGTVIEAGREFKLLARNPLEERSLASYAVADGSLFIRTEKHLYRIDSR
jgi:outer membrane protein assembly factor BamB